MGDVYDEAVEYLKQATADYMADESNLDEDGEVYDYTETPIGEAWSLPKDYEGGILFGFSAPDPQSSGQRDDNGVAVGCLTQIRRSSNMGVYNRPDLTEAIRNDTRIPTDGSEITVESLPVFAEWQRRLDKELGRTPPATIQFDG